MLFTKPLLRIAQPVKVLVFKTNIVTDEEVNDISYYLEANDDVLRWNVDRQDCDNVLRIETNKLLPNEVEGFVREAGYFCEELPD